MINRTYRVLYLVITQVFLLTYTLLSSFYLRLTHLSGGLHNCPLVTLEPLYYTYTLKGTANSFRLKCGKMFTFA